VTGAVRRRGGYSGRWEPLEHTRPGHGLTSSIECLYCACVHSIRSQLNVVPRVLFYCACVQYINYLKNMFRKSVSVYAARLTFSLH